MQFTPTQYGIYMLALLVVTFLSGCSVGNTYRKMRPVAAKKGKK
jgi:uncharacterized lipoprotein